MGDKSDKNTEPELKNIKPQSLITEEHVRKALAADKGEEAVLDSWEVKDFTKMGDNYACVVTSVNVTFTLNSARERVSYVVKLNPCRNFKEWDAFWSALFEKELGFYMKLAPELNAVLQDIGMEGLAVPKCFYGVPETGKELLFLEDLRAKHFSMFDRKKGLDLPHLKLVLAELGKLHAASVILVEKKYKPAGEKITEKHSFLLKDWISYDDTNGEGVIKMFSQYVDNSKSMLETHGGYEQATKWAEGLKPKVEYFLGDYMRSNRCNVICHGDCWNNNLLFRYDEKSGEPTEVMLLDLQLNRYASPATDLNYLMYSSIDGPVRKPNLEKLLAIYYESFKNTLDVGGMDVPLKEEDMTLEFKEKNVYGALMAMMLVPLVLLEAEDVPDLSTGTDTDELVEELTAKVRKMMDTNPSFGPRFLSIFDELTPRDS